MQSIRSKYSVMGLKCKHISLGNIPLNRKYLLVQFVYITDWKSTHVCDMTISFDFVI